MSSQSISLDLLCTIWPTFVTWFLNDSHERFTIHADNLNTSNYLIFYIVCYNNWNSTNVTYKSCQCEVHSGNTRTKQYRSSDETVRIMLQTQGNILKIPGKSVGGWQVWPSSPMHSRCGESMPVILLLHNFTNDHSAYKMSGIFKNNPAPSNF